MSSSENVLTQKVRARSPRFISADPLQYDRCSMSLFSARVRPLTPASRRSPRQNVRPFPLPPRVCSPVLSGVGFGVGVVASVILFRSASPPRPTPSAHTPQDARGPLHSPPASAWALPTPTATAHSTPHAYPAPASYHSWSRPSRLDFLHRTHPVFSVLLSGCPRGGTVLCGFPCTSRSYKTSVMAVRLATYRYCRPPTCSGTDDRHCDDNRAQSLSLRVQSCSHGGSQCDAWEYFMTTAFQPDLFYCILDCLQAESRSVFVSLAQTCRAFSEPSLDRLWSKLDSLEPLVRCFATVWSEERAKVA